MDACRKTRVRSATNTREGSFCQSLVILNFDINCHFYTRHISVQNIGYRCSWSVIIGIGIGPEKRISVDPYLKVPSSVPNPSDELCGQGLAGMLSMSRACCGCMALSASLWDVSKHDDSEADMKSCGHSILSRCVCAIQIEWIGTHY